jgi:hypothetical protein
LLIFRNTGDNHYDTLPRIWYPGFEGGEYAAGPVADFDKDGHNEILAGFEGFVLVFKAIGNSQYIPCGICTTDYSGNGNARSPVLAHDMNHDGYPEFIALGLGWDEALVSVCEATGDGRYHCIWRRHMPLEAYGDASLSVGDVDGDGTEEFLYAEGDGGFGGSIHLFKWAGGDSFSEVWTYDSCSGGGRPTFRPEGRRSGATHLPSPAHSA